MTKYERDGAGAGFVERLIATASPNADRPALIHDHFGRRVLRRWRDVVAEIDRLSAGLAALGVGAGRTVAVGGEVSADLLLVAAAARAAGARLVAVPVAPTVVDLGALPTDGALAAAIVQGRDALETWLADDRPALAVPIVFDHATPERRSPDERIVVVEALRRLAPARGWADGLRGGSRAAPGGSTWLEETVVSGPVLERVLEAWIGGAPVLALPERVGSALRDRTAAAPTRWIATADALDRAAAAIANRLPDAGLGARLLRPVLVGGRSPLAVGLRALVRTRLGLASLGEIELVAGAPAPATLSLFGALGVDVADFVPRTPPEREAERPFSDFTLAPGYPL
ncbi:hypothetical protein [Oharaeibacter diazotrophicus]|uniref:AMP-binding enzyme n=3 Tax=Oharaeibacter diazotrophicus TaxID=1920512 RepID=A0A4R6RFS8_9HYPH|nr:hypothetical protein [Oharaeibacter diazotrophicus]TDP85261.1 AMP-binding enzyme [Oharaeibacter diazotrophicus]BBE74232.1 hypothetical protein OHA_1_03862 [Pleomorphomonas sp. SM30]